MIRCSRNDSSRAKARRAPAGSRAARALTIALLLLAALPAGAATAQAGFSPEGSARALVLDVIHSAQRDLRMLAYTFSAPDIVRALVRAKKRGVDVRLVMDAGESRRRRASAALNTLAAAGIAVRVDDRYQIQHDKLIVADGETVETGSFNFSSAAERYNSENAVVIRNDPAFAAAFQRHWQSRWNDSTPYPSGN